MQEAVKEHVRKLREEIAQITEESHLYAEGGKRMPGARIPPGGGCSKIPLVAYIPVNENGSRTATTVEKAEELKSIKKPAPQIILSAGETFGLVTAR